MTWRHLIQLLQAFPPLENELAFAANFFQHPIVIQYQLYRIEMEVVSDIKAKKAMKIPAP